MNIIEFKQAVDDGITNKTEPKSIPATVVGGLIKDLAQIVDDKVIVRVQNATDFDGVLTIYNDVKAKYGVSGYASSGDVNFRFFGTKISINGIMGNDCGKVEIFINSVSQGIIDLYRSVAQYANIYTKEFDAPGFYEVTVKILGQKNPSSNDVLFYFSDAEFTGKELDVERANDKKPYLENVKTCKDFNDVLNIYTDPRARYGKTGYGNKGELKTNFFGDQVIINGILGTDCGKMEVFIDGVSQGVIDNYRAISRYEALFRKKLDILKFYEISVVILGTKNDASSDNQIYISDFLFFGEKLDKSDSYIERVQNCTDFGGVLTPFVDLRANYGYSAYAEKGEVKTKFFGDQIIISGILGADCGNIEIFIDGVSQGVIDTYRFITRYGVIFAKKFDKSKFYSVVIKILGTKNPNSAAAEFYLSDIRYFGYKLDFGGSSASTTPTANGFFGINALDFGIVNDGVTDNTDALNSLLNQLVNDVSTFGGRTIFFPLGLYRFNGNLLIYKQFQAPILFVGEGCWSTGKGSMYSNGGTIFKFYSTSQDAKLYLKGNGNFQATGITFLNADEASNSELIKSMNTRLHLMNCAFIGNKYGTLCDQDAIVLGGDLEIETPSIDDNGGFQGYGTVIRDNHFNKIRRAVYGKTFANAAVVSSNSVWIDSGSNLPGGAAFEFDGGLDPNGAQHLAGGHIENNLVEVHNYTYAFKLGKTYAVNLFGNMVYDAGQNTVAAYYLGAKAERNLIIPGFMPVPNSQYGNIKIVKDDSVIKTNRVVFGEIINGDVNEYPTN